MSTIINFTRILNGAETLIVTAEPDTSSNIKRQLLGDNVATLSFILSAKYNFNIGDFANIYGEIYFISKPVLINKLSNYRYAYNITMETRQCKLRNAQYLFYDAQNILLQSDFSLTGTANDFIDLLLKNAARTGEAWVKGGVIQTGYKTLTFSKENCLDVLAKIAEAFETEFFVQETTIHVAKRINATSHYLTYGRNRGLYTIDRQLVEDTLFTRLYVYGGAQNLPPAYRNFSPRLLMDSSDACLLTDLRVTVTPIVGETNDTYRFDFNLPENAKGPTPTITSITLHYRRRDSMVVYMWEEEVSTLLNDYRLIILPRSSLGYDFYFTVEGGTCDGSSTEVLTSIKETDNITYFQKPSILEKNINVHGVIEGSLIIDDIVPEREGTVTAGDVSNVYKFKDTSLDFDINESLLPGIAAKVIFQTGQLAGYSFELSKYNNSTKEFTILKNKEEKALDLPSTFLKPEIGDKYILVDILLPQAYITLAEKKLRAKATEYLNLKADPSYKYVVACDPAYFRRQNIKLEVGDMIHLLDIDLQVDKDIRILSLTRSLLDEYQYEIELGDIIKSGTLQSIQSAITINANNAAATNQQLNNSALFNGTYIGTFKIEQGTLIITEIETVADLSAMKKLYIDPQGKIWKEA